MDGVALGTRDIVGPGWRMEHAMATLGDKVVLFGGRASAGIVNDTWEWDGQTWTQRQVSGPAARWEVGMAAR